MKSSVTNIMQYSEEQRELLREFILNNDKLEANHSLLEEMVAREERNVVAQREDVDAELERREDTDLYIDYKTMHELAMECDKSTLPQKVMRAEVMASARVQLSVPCSRAQVVVHLSAQRWIQGVHQDLRELEEA